LLWIEVAVDSCTPFFRNATASSTEEKALKRPLILPHPDINLKQPAPCPAVRPGISSSFPWNLRPAAVWDGIDRVALQVAWQERHSSKNILHRADIEC
jgi:hypothetical protein